MTELIISDAGRTPIVAQRRNNGGLLIHAAKRVIALSRDESERLAAFIRDEARLVCYPVTTPAKARLTE